MRFLILLLFLTPALRSQNSDQNSERMSDDILFLRALYGISSVGSYSLTPAPLATILDQQKDSTSVVFLKSLNTSVHSYYAAYAVDEQTSGGVWLEHREDRMHLLSFRDSMVRLQCDIGGMLRSGSIETSSVPHSFVLGNLNARAIGSLDKHLGFMLYLSNGILFHGDQAFVKQTDQVLSRTLKFTELEQKFFDRYIGYLQYQSDYLRIRFGREAFSWGYSPIDNLVHSRFAPLTDGLLINVPYKSLRFSSVHAAVDGVDVNGKQIEAKFIASHRLQFEAASWLSIAVNDMLVYSGRGLDFAYLNPLAFYVSTGLNNRSRSEFDNSLLGFDLALRPINRTLIYAALLLDDYSFDSMTDTTAASNNNKYAFQLGLTHLVDLQPRPLLLSAEYVRVAPFTYSHRQINNSWTHSGAPLGYNIQPNSDRMALQLKYWISARSYVQVDVDYTRWGENILDSAGNILTTKFISNPNDTLILPIGNVGGDMLRGDGDFLPAQFAVGNHFLKGNVSHTRRIQFLVSSEIYPNVFLDARAQYFHRNSGNNPTSQFWYSIELRIGY